MKLVYIDDTYIKYLRQFDTRVLWNKERRPYVGILLSVNNFTYFAPLESAKQGKRTNRRLALQIWNRINIDKDPISFLLINDMIPVSKTNWRQIDLETEKKRDLNKYLMLMNELNYLRPREVQIIKQAHSVYNNTTVKKVPFFKKMCLNFKLLETKSLVFDNRNNNTNL
ncbi:type III toxin-antitoxin system ToxN/AbiQ family toxin [Lactiplantibacillus nangangensis]|uniref:Type III toxin-antitoxin system ToxN/AbiQ family toxin n=1 Tax=Lactiplantibacillus nangangensis TaxID=2559917 RepID=A0ABW1SMV6_9LACO|nr:type III toxin-antitoxin system ToxN/AbiQ family toxin [Lactiplantibacillus nangangensis]